LTGSDILLRGSYLALALLPGLLWLRHYYLKDVFEPEPKALVARMFALGAVAFVAAYAIQVAMLRAAASYGFPLTAAGTVPAAVRAFGVVSLSEECIKLFFVWWFVFGHAEFDEPMDGVVYAISCALGFATIENASYMYTYESSTILMVRMVFSCFLHAGCSGLAGYHLGRAKFDRGRALGHVTIGLSAAWFLHGLYDFFVFSRWFHALFLIIGLLWLVKLFLDSRIEDALERSPFKPADDIV